MGWERQDLKLKFLRTLLTSQTEQVLIRRKEHSYNFFNPEETLRTCRSLKLNAYMTTMRCHHQSIMKYAL
jgi:hypothetical protein